MEYSGSGQWALYNCAHGTKPSRCAASDHSWTPSQAARRQKPIATRSPASLPPAAAAGDRGLLEAQLWKTVRWPRSPIDSWNGTAPRGLAMKRRRRRCLLKLGPISAKIARWKEAALTRKRARHATARRPLEAEVSSTHSGPQQPAVERGIDGARRRGELAAQPLARELRPYSRVPHLGETRAQHHRHRDADESEVTQPRASATVGELELSHAERRAENKEHRALRGVREVVKAADGSEVRVGESGGGVGERRRGAGRQKEE
eukprot:scaffold74103_cov60-Phaeocystis_antarctica.AAC.3